MLARLLLALLIALQAFPPVGLCSIVMASRCGDMPAACTPVSCCSQAPCSEPETCPPGDPRDCCLLGPCAPDPALPVPPPTPPAKLHRATLLVSLPDWPAATPLARIPHDTLAIPQGRLRPTLCIWVI